MSVDTKQTQKQLDRTNPPFQRKWQKKSYKNGGNQKSTIRWFRVCQFHRLLTRIHVHLRTYLPGRDLDKCNQSAIPRESSRTLKSLVIFKIVTLRLLKYHLDRRAQPVRPSFNYVCYAILLNEGRLERGTNRLTLSNGKTLSFNFSLIWYVCWLIDDSSDFPW